AANDDVQPAVVEPFQHLVHARTCPEVAYAVLICEDEAELALLVEALADQLAVARLEDVQRHALRRQEDDPEREEAELLHGATGYVRPPTLAEWLPTGFSRCSAPPFRRRTSWESRTGPA